MIYPGEACNEPIFGDAEEPRPKFTYLGYYWHMKRNYDLWYGPDAVEPTVIARFGTDGPDYMSGMVFGWVPDNPEHPLVVARQRAQKLGFDVCQASYENRVKRNEMGWLYCS